MNGRLIALGVAAIYPTVVIGRAWAYQQNDKQNGYKHPLHEYIPESARDTFEDIRYLFNHLLRKNHRW